MLTLLLILILIGACVVATRADRANAHRPGLHPAGQLEAPKLHWLVHLRQTTNHVLADKCRPRPARSMRPAAVVPEFLRVFTIRVELGRLADARGVSSLCLPTSWLAAVEWAQRAFPGTSSWLLSCSASEGGWGRFVMNARGSSAGGWLQFMPGTFYANVSRAIGEARARGLTVPGSAGSWYHPAGQALTGASMYRRGLSYHWAGAGC